MNKIIGKIYKRLKRLFAKDADELRIRKLRNLYYNHKDNVNVNVNVNDNVNDNDNGNGLAGAVAGGVPTAEPPAAPPGEEETRLVQGFIRMRGVRGLWRSITTIKEVLKEYEDTCYLR